MEFRRSFFASWSLLVIWWCLASTVGTLDTAAVVVSAPHLISYPSPVNHFSNSRGLLLSCLATGPKPLSVTWQTVDRDGKAATTIPGVREVLSNGSLHFYPFSQLREDVHGARYRCAVSNPVATVLSPVFQVKAVMDEDWQVGIRVQSGGESFLENNPVLLECHVDKAKYWSTFVKVLAWKEIDQFGHEREIQKEKDRDRYVITGGEAGRNLLILAAPIQRLFVCVAQNTLSLQVKASQHFLLKAKRLSSQNSLAPRPTTNVFPQKFTQKKGNAVLDLVCLVTGNPVPIWRWEKRDLVSGRWTPVSNFQHSIPGPLLRLKSKRDSDRSRLNGTYRCEASNTFGTSTVEYSVELEQPLEIGIKPERVVAYPGQNVEFSCFSNWGKPDFVWYKNGKPLASTSRVSVVVGAAETLKVLNVRLEDQGVYQCFAENGTLATAQLIFPPSAPELVHTFISQSVPPGPSISLKCSALGNPAPEISWFIDDLMVSSSESGAGANNPRKYLWMGQQQQSRFHFSTALSSSGEVVSTLNISAVSVEDSGLYRCTAQNLVNATSHSARLNVFGGIFVREMADVVTTYAHGDTIFLPCHYGGFPMDKVIWQKDGANLAKVGPELGQNKFWVFPNGTLRIANLVAESGARGDKGRYTCVVSNRKGEVASGSLSIDVMHPPEISPLRLENMVVEGKRTSISCDVSSGELPITISWLKDQHPLPAAQLNISESRVTKYLSVLAFDQLSELHSGEYTCLAENKARLVKQSASLLVRASPKWTRIPENRTKAVLGSEHVLECEASGVPPPTIQWFRESASSSNGIKVGLRTNHKFVLSGGGNGSLLKIRTVEEDDAGLYFCQADNGVGAAIQSAAQLSVIIPATIVKPSGGARQKSSSGGGGGSGDDDAPLVVVIAEGATATLPCKIRGDRPIQVTWKKNSVAIQPSSSASVDEHFSLVPLNSSVYAGEELKIGRAGLEHAAVYECHAANQYGRDEMKIQLQVKARPKTPEDFRVEEIGSRAIRLKWQPVSGESDPITQFIIQWKNQEKVAFSGAWEDDSQNVSVPAYQNSASVENLHPVTTYGVRILAQNRYGHSLPSAPLVVLTLAEAPSGPPLNLTAYPTGPKEVYLRWKPPDITKQHGTIQGYRVMAIPQTTFSSGKNLSLNRDVKLEEELKLQGVRPNTQYRITVRAYNSAGLGPESPAIFIQTPEGAPDQPPRHVKCEALSPKSVQVQWDSPAEQYQNGHIQGYKVSYLSVDGERLGEKPEVKKTGNKETTLHGLKSFTNYSVRVLAYTVGGESETSESVQCSTEEDVPGEPADVKVLSGGQTAAVVSWLPPHVSNGVISKYTVYWRESEGESTVREKHVAINGGNGNGQYSTEIKRLRENGQYKVWVSAWTGAGQGKPSKQEVVRVIPSSYPQIASFSVQKSVAVGDSVSLPCQVVGEGRLRWFKDGSMETRQVAKNGSLLINRVKDQDEGEYVCRVDNDHGSDEIMHRVRISRPPGKLSVYLGYVTSLSVQVHWEVLERVNPPLFGYLLEWRPSGGTWTAVKLAEHVSTHVLENLKCGTEYQLRVAGVNRVGRGQYSEPITTKTNGGPPEDKPRLTEILDGNGTMVRIDLSRWPDGGCPVRRVHVEYRKVGETSSGESGWIPVVQYRDQGESGHHQKVWTLRTEMKARYEIQVKLENDAGLVQKRFSVESHPDFFRNYAKVLERVEKEREKGAETAQGKVVPFYTDPHVLVPIVSAVICTAAAAVCLLMVVVRRRNLQKQRETQRESEWKFTGNPGTIMGPQGRGELAGINRGSWLSPPDNKGGRVDDQLPPENTQEIYATLNSTKPIPMTIRDSTVRLHSFGSFDNYEAAPTQHYPTGQYLKKKRKSVGGGGGGGGSTPLTPVDPLCGGIQQVNCGMDYPGRIIEPPQEFRSFHSGESVEEPQYQKTRFPGVENRLEDVYHDYSYPYHGFPVAGSSSSEMLAAGNKEPQQQQPNGRHTLRKSGSGRSKGGGGSKRNSRGDDDLFQ